ncbi:MAG: DUF362 domain-containing protein [Patescibacteria group bacterium]
MSVNLVKYNINISLVEQIQNLLLPFNINFGKRVFIKSNLSARPPEIKGENTSLLFIDALVKYLINSKCSEIIVGHSSLIGTKEKSYPFELLIKASGFYKLLNNKQVTLLDLDNVERQEIEINSFKYKIPKIIHQVDSYINLGVLKTHMETTVSLSMKNQMGLLELFGRKDFHKKSLEKPIAYLSKMIKPKISILEGIIGMEGNGPHDGTSKKANLIIASDNMLELDTLGCYLMGIDYENIEHIKEAKKIGVGNFINIETENKYKDYIVKFKQAEKIISYGKKIKVYPTTSCSFCQQVLRTAGKKLKSNFKTAIIFLYKAYFSKKEIRIIMGTGKGLESFDSDDIIIPIGICTKEWCEKRNLNGIYGCPPDINIVSELILNKIKGK